ncbi:GNAT family N-acetyltransferase [soil metagenome]
MIDTPRLVLREWTNADITPMQAICSDPDVMRHLGPALSIDDTRAWTTRHQAYQAELGYGFWAVERKDDRALLGFCGLKPGAEGTPVADQVEIGWRLGKSFWGQGYAQEAAQASLDWGWAHLPVDSIWAITTPGNAKSQALMLRLGMAHRRYLDFDHPNNPVGDPLRPHLTFSISRPEA